LQWYNFYGVFTTSRLIARTDW